MTSVIALLWTWLERHILDLGSLHEKPSIIQRRALDAPPFRGMDEDLLGWVTASPLRNAAELLARISCRYGDADTSLADTTIGIDGEPVVVAWRRSELVRRMSGSEYPPSADEHPSLTTLAPALSVCPVDHAEIELHMVRPHGTEWELAQQKLEAGLIDVAPTLEIHLDTLGEAGLSKWWIDPEMDVGALREEEVLPDQRIAALDAVRSAVRAAAGPARMLLLPELAAVDEVVGAIGEELRALGNNAPALTVVGRYHRRDEDQAEHPERARYFNEAVVLGPMGGVIWSHRKLSSAAGTVPTDDGPREIVEDTQLGRSLDVVSSPLGNLAVAICLDTFAGPSRDRLARSPANILLVPSLSPKVLRHRSSLGHLVQALFGIAFVCNRASERPPDGSNWNEPKNRSFWAIQRQQITEPATSEGSRPSFVFRLDQAS